jgi:hypothetical protein
MSSGIQYPAPLLTARAPLPYSDQTPPRRGTLPIMIARCAPPYGRIARIAPYCSKQRRSRKKRQRTMTSDSGLGLEAGTWPRPKSSHAHTTVGGGAFVRGGASRVTGSRPLVCSLHGGQKVQVWMVWAAPARQLRLSPLTCRVIVRPLSQLVAGRGRSCCWRS